MFDRSFAMLNKIMRFPGFRSKAFTMSYDDGAVFDERMLDVMNKHGIKGSFNICSGSISDPEQIVKRYAGHEVAVHGREHLALARAVGADAVADILDDRRALEKMFGRVIRGMAYADGSFSDDIVALLKMLGFAYARTTQDTGRFDIPSDWLRLGATCHHTSPRLFEYTENFLSADPNAVYARYPLFFNVWGHSFEFDRMGNWELLDRLCDEIGGREDEIWYATTIEIYDYTKAYGSLIWSADSSIVYNPTLIDIYMEYRRKNVFIPSGKIINISEV